MAQQNESYYFELLEERAPNGAPARR